MKGTLKLGTSGFSFKDWRGVVYPKKMPMGDALTYYQDELGFEAVEINSTYYTLVSERSFAGMERKTGPGFEFVVKAYRGITHDPFDERLGKDRLTLDQARENIEKFKYSLRPLTEAGKLGAVLLQFPVFFYPSKASDDYLIECRKMFGAIPLVIEFRNKGWSHPPSFAFLRKHSLAYCTVDEPHLPRLMPFVNKVTSDIAYMRFHGRNREWFNAPIAKRHNYLYSTEQLKGFVPEIEKMSSEAKKTFVFFNNSHAAYAARNAITLRELLGLKPAARLLV